MAQKAICPRGHIWDPSTLAGLPPTETPRCPICGEEDTPRVGNSLARLNRGLRKNPLVTGLSALCFLLTAALLLSLLRAREGGQAALEQNEKGTLAAKTDESNLSSRLRIVEEENKDLKNQVKSEKEKKANQEKELNAEVFESKKEASEFRKQRDEQIHQRKLAEELSQTADQLRQEALSRRAEAARKLVKMYVADGTRLMENGDLSASLLWFAEALRLAESEKQPAETHRLRIAAVLARCPRPVQVWLPDKRIKIVQLSSEGKRMLTAAADGTVEVWDTATGKRMGGVLAHAEAVTRAVFSPDGKRVLTAAADMTLHLWEVENGQEVFMALQLRGPVAGLAFSADGKRFLTVTDKAPMGATEVELHVREAATGEPVREEALGSEVMPRSAVFSPDGQGVLTICQDRCARIWDIATGKQVGSSFTHAAALVQASFSFDGERVLTASADGTARVWKAKTGAPLSPLFKHGSAVRDASLSPEGRYVLTIGEDRNVRVWDTKTPETAGASLRHAEAVNDAVFAPDGRYVLTASADGAVRLWDHRRAEEILPALRQGAAIHYAAFTPAGDGVLTWAEQVVRLWDLTVGVEPLAPSSRNEAGLVAFSPDGTRVLRATETVVRVYDTQTKQPVGGTLPHKDKVTAAAFSADGKRLLTICHVPNGDQREGHVRVWETATGELLGQPLVHPSSVLEASFGRDGRRVLTACQDGKARLWDVAKNALVGEPMEHKQDLSRALFVPDGKHVLTVDAEGGLRLWDAATAEAVGPTWGHRKPILHLVFSPDAQQLATASEDGTASVWEASTGHEIATTPVQNAPVIRTAFSPNGKRILTVSADRQVRVWEAGNGKPASPPLRHRAAVSLAAFSDDGKRIVTLAADGVRVWEAASGEPVSPLMRTSIGQADLHAVSLGRDGRLILATGDPSAPWVRAFRADERPAAELARIAEVLSGERMTDAGETAPLDRAPLSKFWQEVRKKSEKEFSLSPERLAAWHRQGAVECEHAHLWVGAARHLDRLISTGASAELYARRGRANLELKRWESAKTDYTRALASEGGRWDLLAGRGEAEAALGRWQEAEADYSKAIEQKNDRAELWAARGRIEAERGDWRKAAADLGKALHLGEQDAAVWRQHILALLVSGEEANYRRWCGRLVQRFGDSKDEAIFRSVVWTCALKADALSDWKLLLQRVERAATANSQSTDLRRQRAVLLYRTGKYDSSLAGMRELTRQAGDKVEEIDWLLMAMAAQRLGRADEAKTWLDKAEQIRQKRAKKSHESWEDRLLYQTLHREAEALVKAEKRGSSK